MRLFALLVFAITLMSGRVSHAADVDGALGVVVGRPLGSELSNVYPFTLGLALDVRFFHSSKLGVSIQSAPALGSGTPETGALAGGAEGQLLLWPSHLIVEYAPSRGTLRPYAGAGLGLVYVHESLSFSGPLGEEESSVSMTRVSIDVLVGVERGSVTRLFAELHYQHAGTSGVEEQSGSGVSLANLQLRLGVRTRLK